MKSIIILAIGALFLVTGGSHAAAQPPAPPAGASDKNLEDRNIKNRSIELERIKRDAGKPDKGSQQPEKMPEAKFREIKEDFERIQLSQSEIITAYTKAKEIDFAKISSTAEEINRRGTRLKGNLFQPADDRGEDKKDRAGKKEVELPRLPADIKMLIVEMDNTLAAFTSNPMFTNPQVVNADSSAKARSDLARLIRLSAELKREAEKAARKED